MKITPVDLFRINFFCYHFTSVSIYRSWKFYTHRHKAWNSVYIHNLKNEWWLWNAHFLDYSTFLMWNVTRRIFQMFQYYKTWMVNLIFFCLCRRYGTKCGGCLEGINPSDLVRKARDKVFHLNCFTCLVCRKQMSTGEELYVLDDNKFVCKEDYLSGKPLPVAHHVHGHHGMFNN